MEWTDFFSLLCGLFWAMAYFFFIWKGFREKTYCIPMPFIAFNLAWEITFGFIYPDPNPLWMWINRTWALIDIILATQVVLYGARNQPDPDIRKVFLPGFLFAFPACLAFVILFTQYYGDHDGTQSAFLSNIFMSAFFIPFLLVRKDLRGISLAGSWCRMLGTLFASLATWTFYPKLNVAGKPFSMMHFTFFLILALDLWYLALYYRVAPARRRITAAE